MSSEQKKLAVDWVEDSKELIVDAHQKIWEYAEHSLCEDRSSELVAEKLKGRRQV